MEKEKLKELIDKGLSIRQITKELKTTNAKLRYALKKFNLKTKGRNGIYNWDKDIILNSIKKSECKSDILRNMNITTRSGNFQTLDRYCKLYSIDISHLRYKNNRGNKFKKIEDKDIFIKNSSYTSSYKLKKRAIASGLLKNKCFKCGNEGQWCGEELFLQMDHINGIKTDNRIKNLRIACPNCHSQTITYRGRKNRIKK
jgi:5-methylcytosine-specific restriction endonuclease McrA